VCAGGLFGFGGKNKNGNPLDALGTGVLRYSKTGTFPEKKRRRTEMASSKFQEIKALIQKGEKFGFYCLTCAAQGSRGAGTSVRAGSKNVRVVACEHEIGNVQAILAKFDIVPAQVNHFVQKTEEQKKNGAWNGCEIIIRREQVDK
jgi:hypothetical protein